MINENKHKQNANNENHSMHHLIHEVVWEIVRTVDHHREIWEDLIIILLHEAEDVQKDHSVCICFLYINERLIVLCLDANNFGAFGGDNSMRGGSGPPSRGGSSQRGGNRGGGGGGVSDEMMKCLKMSFLLLLALRWTIRW